MYGTATRILHADAVLPGDASAICDGAVVVDASGTVLDLGPAARILPSHAGARTERIEGAIAPALINAHTHLELSALRGKIPGGNGFVAWVDGLVAERARAKPDENQSTIEHALEEVDRSGTCAVADVSNTLAALPALATRSIAGFVFREIVGLDPDRALAAVDRARLDPLTCGAVDAHDLQVAPAVHTLYTTHPIAVLAVLEMARQRRQRTTVHLAEHPAEREFLQTGGGPFIEFARRRGLDSPRFPVFGRAPVQVAAELGMLAPDVLLVHLTDILDHEIPLVARSGASIVLCPRSNWFIERRFPPVHAWLRAGVVPALGTDSLASNESLDVLAEAAALERAYPDLPPRTLLEMATAAGARALGRPDLGHIAVGARPGLIAFEGPIVGDPFAWVLDQPPSVRRWIARRQASS